MVMSEYLEAISILVILLVSSISIAVAVEARDEKNHHHPSNKKGLDDDDPFLHLQLPTFISSHMVLQRAPMKARIWGWARPDVNITVTLDQSATVQTVTSKEEDHSWFVDLPPQPASTGHTLNISTSFTSILLEDIAFGDVYFCSGQSNMQFSVIGAMNGAKEIQDSIHYPHIRLATVERVMADQPQRDVPSRIENVTWTRSQPSAFHPTDVMAYTSAVAYFFARDLYVHSNGTIPIGIVVSAWGGQPIEPFSSPEALKDETCGGTVLPPRDVASAERQQDTTTERRSLLRSQLEHQSTTYNWSESSYDESENDSKIWNGMIHPFLPMRFKGVVWYQGESNSQNPTSYACRFPAMISDWRKQFQLPDLFFYYVQLAPIKTSDGGSHNWPYIRAAQDAALQLPQVGVAIASDLGDPNSPHQDIHPRYKQEIGQRLSLLTRSFEYEDEGLVYQGPIFDGTVEWVGDAASVILGFRPETARGLHFNGTKHCDACCDDSSLPFEAFTSSGEWVHVESKIIGDNRILLELDQESSWEKHSLDGRVNNAEQILGIRFNWEAFPQCTLYNNVQDGLYLPAAPFEWCAFQSGEKPWSKAEFCRVSPASVEEAATSDEATLSHLRQLRD